MDRFLVALVRILPRRLFSRFAGVAARIPLFFPLNFLLIRAYSAIFHVKLSESEFKPSQYRTLNEFFIRKLKPDARPIDPEPKSIVSPVDGAVLQVGNIGSGALPQAKGRTYPVRELLGDPSRAAHFLQGSFCTIYLSPSDYHRIHAPLDGQAESLRYISGDLYPVNRLFLSSIQNLFVLNERMIVHLKTQSGNAAMVMVGATSVGKIRILFDDLRPQLFRKKSFQRSYGSGIDLQKGAEMACFELGSTVILLFEKESADLTVRQGDRVRMGETIGFLP